MRKAKATYYAPPGDNPVVTMGGQRFIDGQSVELNSDEHGPLIDKLQTNQHFDIEVGEDEKTPHKRGVGRPKASQKDVEKKQHDYADSEEAMRKGTAGVRPGSDWQGGPYPVGVAHGVPGVPPLAEGNEGGTAFGAVTSDKKPGSGDAKHAKHK